MKVGDLVRQGNRVMKIRHGKNVQKPSKQLGIVIAIRDMPSPCENEKPKLQNLMNMLGRCVDVLWENGKLTENFSENSLEIINNTKLANVKLV